MSMGTVIQPSSGSIIVAAAKVACNKYVVACADPGWGLEEPHQPDEDGFAACTPGG